jgi:NOL1/NOP2/sun family putative RNA methylase
LQQFTRYLIQPVDKPVVRKKKASSSAIAHYDIPDMFLQRMSGFLEGEYDAFVSSMKQALVVGLRVNTLKITPRKFIDVSPFPLSPVTWCQSGFSVQNNENAIDLTPGKHPYHHAGLYYLQELSAMAAAEVLAAHPGEKVLDLSAAPGGKTTHLACLMKNSGLLVANEINPHRVWDLAENLERLGVTNAIILNETPDKLVDHFSEYFDRILVDAPCSGEGMFRKSELARREWNPRLPHRCSVRQQAILEQAAKMLKPGGSMAYTTCTFAPEENEGVISSFLEAHPEFSVKITLQQPGFDHARPEWVGLPPDHVIKGAIRIWPHHAQAEGHFICLLVKTEETEELNREYPSRLRPARLKTDRINFPTMLRSRLETFSGDTLSLTFDDMRLQVHGSYLYQAPEIPVDIAGLRSIRPGWWIGTIKNETFTPSHSLAMGIQPDQVKRAIQFHPGDPEIRAYLRGESLLSSGADGWILIKVDDYPIGWGKRVKNTIKNYYPHGLRKYSEG